MDDWLIIKPMWWNGNSFYGTAEEYVLHLGYKRGTEAFKEMLSITNKEAHDFYLQIELDKLLNEKANHFR